MNAFIGYITSGNKHSIGIIIILSWLALFYRSIAWFSQTLVNNYSLANLALLSLILFALTKTVYRQQPGKLHFKFRYLPFLIIAFSIPLYYYIESRVYINILSAVVCFLSAYGLAGFFVPVSAWRKGIIPVMLLILTLPFGTQLDIYFGFPLRLHAAETVLNVLSLFDINALSKETIITIENRSAEVNTSCSGMNGLWTSWVFFLVITWIEKRKPGLQWAVYFILINLLIYGFNLFRICLLVVLETVLTWHDLANMIHIPLGLTGFVLSCLITWGSMILFWKKETGEESIDTKSPSIERPGRSKMVLTGILAVSMVFTSFAFPEEIRKPMNDTSGSECPSLAGFEEIALSKGETNSFLKEGAYGRKFRFHIQGQQGTCLLVSSSGWRGHHPPDLCIQASGFTIETTETRLVKADFPVQMVHLKDTSQKACYWFQSSGKITQDHASRVWDALKGGHQHWIMVSILFDNPDNQFPSSAEPILLDIQTSIQTQLNTRAN